MSHLRALCAVVFAACGPVTSTEDPTPGSTGPTGSTGATTGYVYSTQPAAATTDAALTLYTTQGAAGAAWVGPHGGLGSTVELFVKPTPAGTFTYAKDPLTNMVQTRDGFIAALNTRGANGFAFKTLSTTPGVTQIFFVKNTSKSTTFTYTGDPPSADKAAFTALLQQRGAAGFSYVGDVIPNATDLSTWTHVFQNDGVTTSFGYTVTTLLNDRTTLAAELDARGKAGELWKGAFVIGAEQISLYEKRGSTAAVTCVLDDNAQNLVAALNVRGADGYFYFGSYLAGGTTTLVYCKGALTALPLLGTVLP